MRRRHSLLKSDAKVLLVELKIKYLPYVGVRSARAWHLELMCITNHNMHFLCVFKFIESSNSLHSTQGTHIEHHKWQSSTSNLIKRTPEIIISYENLISTLNHQSDMKTWQADWPLICVEGVNKGIKSYVPNTQRPLIQPGLGVWISSNFWLS